MKTTAGPPAATNTPGGWRRYLDDDASEPMGLDTVRRALADAYYDVPLALDFLHEAGRIRTPAAMYEAVHV